MDFWSIAVLILAGWSPFNIGGVRKNPDQNTENCLFKSDTGETNSNSRIIISESISVLKGFLNKNSVNQLDCRPQTGFGDIVNYPFFKSTEWTSLEEKIITQPYQPRHKYDRDPTRRILKIVRKLGLYQTFLLYVIGSFTFEHERMRLMQICLKNCHPHNACSIWNLC